jgi:UDP-N-acetylglucosamine--N-acetylmuramyl-(pentapeptide) pyrophosphoryl-undecaprenol N-acetylglucosamine transferase
MATIGLAGGGTGGHVYPALAIGDVLKERGHQVIYYGDPGRLEARVAPERGYAFRPVRALQYPRGGIIGKIRFAFGLLRSTWATRSQLRADRVDLVLGVGGYISAPPVLAAWSLRKKRMIHEANAVPGLANKLCARVSQLILLTFERTRKHMSAHAPCHLVGVPVNPAVLSAERAEACQYYNLSPEKPVVVFVGGSLGARRINELALASIGDEKRTFQVLHLCGPRFLEEVKTQLAEVPTGVTLKGYEDRMGMAYASADLVVCRAGSSTLAELTAVGKASLLIPSPNVTENHQEENARGLEEVGAADVLLEHGWQLEQALEQVNALAADAERLKSMGIAAQGHAKLDAAQQAADLLEGLLN